MEVGPLDRGNRRAGSIATIAGGMLVQDADVADDPEGEWQVVTQAQPTPEQMTDLRFAWGWCGT